MAEKETGWVFDHLDSLHFRLIYKFVQPIYLGQSCVIASQRVVRKQQIFSEKHSATPVLSLTAAESRNIKAIKAHASYHKKTNKRTS